MLLPPVYFGNLFGTEIALMERIDAIFTGAWYLTLLIGIMYLANKTQPVPNWKK